MYVHVLEVKARVRPVVECTMYAAFQSTLTCFSSGMKSELETTGKGPDRNSADYRIKKAQVLYCIV